MRMVVPFIFGLSRVVNGSEKISTGITILVLDINEKLSEFIKIKCPYHTCLLLVNF